MLKRSHAAQVSLCSTFIAHVFASPEGITRSQPWQHKTSRALCKGHNCIETYDALANLPLLVQDMEQKQIAPELYPYGSRGPVGAHYLAAKHGVRWGDMVDNPELEL